MSDLFVPLITWRMIFAWVNDESQEFTRGSMKYLRIYLAQKEEESELAPDMQGGDSD